MRFDQIIQQLQEQQLDEVRMGQSDLDSFVTSPEAQGIVAGFEAELCFRGKGGGDSYDSEPEEDTSDDTRPDSIDEICDFFEDGDYNGRREIERLRERLQEGFFEWRSEKLSEGWSEAETEAVKEYIEENDFDFDDEIETYLRDELNLDEQQLKTALAAGKEGSRITSSKQLAMFADENEAFANWAEARDHVDSMLDEKVEESINDQDRNYDRAREEWEEYHADEYEESDWLRSEGIDWMTDIPRNYDVSWPYWNYPENEASNEFNEAGADDLANSLRRSLGVEVRTGSYHSVKRTAGRWIIEEDGSLEADEGDMPAEIVSPPMPLDECLTKMDEFFEWARSEDAYSNESTGLHVGMSLPFVKGNVDYVKLALFLGDQYVLQEFDRMSNTFCKSALAKIEQQVKQDPNRLQNAMDLMRKGLIELASTTLKQTSGHGKYTSINLKGDYIEFRSMGGDYFDHPEKVTNMVKRYAYAMYIASRPDLHRDEYAKKLYKMLSGDGNENIINYFSQYSAGKLSKEQLLGVLRAAKAARKPDSEPESSTPIPGSTLDLQRQRASQSSRAVAGGEFTGNWIVTNAAGNEVYRFGGIGNSQGDANRVASQWLRDQGLTSATGFDVVPEMR